MIDLSKVKQNGNAVKNTGEIKALALGLGADLVGIADTGLLKGAYLFIPELLDYFPYAISIAISVEKFGSSSEKIDSSFAEQIALLERVAIYVKDYINENSHEALIIHPEDCLNRKEMRPIISNKAVAKTAGIGWIGKSLLLVTPNLGPRVRLISIFTDMPLVPSVPQKCQCGDCTVCIEACPKKALKNTDFIDHPESREQVLDVSKCEGERGCKVCMLSCPIGK